LIILSASITEFCRTTFFFPTPQLILLFLQSSSTDLFVLDGKKTFLAAASLFLQLLVVISWRPLSSIDDGKCAEDTTTLCSQPATVHSLCGWSHWSICLL